MSAVLTSPASPATPPAGPLHRRIAWHLRHGPKRELWLAWATLVVFYNLFFPMFFIVAQVQPPPQPTWDLATQVHWFHERHLGIPIGFGIIFVVTGMTAVNNALIAYSMRRMSVSRGFGYSYLLIYSLSAIPGMLLLCVALIVGTLRPERNPEAVGWLYDFAFLSFDGTMGVFLIGSLIWMLAILLDKNRVFPKWFGYLNLCNALTEVVVAPCWIFRRGVLAWNGQIAWWLDMVVFGVYQVTFIVMLFRMIQREDFGTGPLPDLARKRGGYVMTDLADKNKRATFVPGQPDMWAFVLFETLVFTGYFGFYLFYRARSPELFLHSQAHLDLRIGVLNTLVLLLSSWSVARCVQSARAGAYRAALRDAYITAAFAAVFLFFKVFEWARLVGMGNGLDSNDFFTYYFFLTGIHFVHLLIGFVVLGVIVYQLRAPARRSQELVETCATYWHTVDFLWVLIFALLYVVR